MRGYSLTLPNNRIRKLRNKEPNNRIRKLQNKERNNHFLILSETWVQLQA